MGIGTHATAICVYTLNICGIHDILWVSSDRECDAAGVCDDTANGDGRDGSQ